jgi:hypothetical protein
MTRQVSGSFDITRTAEPPFDTADGVVLGRMRFDKTFHGPLAATSVVHMTSAMTAVKGSAGYVAVERITGSLDGKAGSFVVLHTGLMDRGAPSLTITVVPDSGTGELVGLAGEMAIEIVEGKHHYRMSYTLGGA